LDRNLFSHFPQLFSIDIAKWIALNKRIPDIIRYFFMYMTMKPKIRLQPFDQWVEIRTIQTCTFTRIFGI
ncbi:hypothetical protein CGI42_28255, partial [Vibrio parahaemolyticus]